MRNCIIHSFKGWQHTIAVLMTCSHNDLQIKYDDCMDTKYLRLLAKLSILLNLCSELIYVPVVMRYKV